MEQFTDFDLLYKHLEESAADYRYIDQISRLFQRIRDLKHEKSELADAEKAQREMDVFNFRLEDDEIKPMFTATNDKGEAVVYPSIDGFKENAYAYLIERLNNVSNPVLKARYSHILWHGTTKHIKYAKIAIDSYLELIKIYKAKDIEKPEDHYGLFVLEIVKNAYFLAKKVKYKIDVVKSELKRLVLEFNFDSQSSFALRHNIIDFMLKEKREFCLEDYKGFEDICKRISDNLVGIPNLHAAIEILLLGERIDNKTGVKTNEWRALVAGHYETLMNQAMKSTNLVAQYFCQNAIDSYKKIKNKEKIKELEKKYIEIKESMKFGEFKTEIDIREHVKLCRNVAQRLAEKSPEEIITNLTLGKQILPKYKDMEKTAEQHSKKFVLQSIMPTEIIDLNGHPVQIFSGEEEIRYYRILWQYDFELRFNKIILIREIFLAAIKRNKLKIESVMDFLRKYSWFGKTISKTVGNGKQIQYNWLNLLAPSLSEYFYQINYHFANPSYLPNFILSIDSLTLKLEGLIRDICQFCGIVTFYFTKDAKNRKIAREKDIHALLYEKEIKNLFDEDDLIFFKFLLVEQAGYNLRHKVAHALMFFQEYDIDRMHLLILALLKLGKYDFVEKE